MTDNTPAAGAEQAIREALAAGATSAIYTHPRDDNRWRENEALAIACSPDNLHALLNALAAKDAEIARLQAALQKIERWDLPLTGKFWDEEKTRPTSFETEYGSNGARNYMREVARIALSQPMGNGGEQR